jgi:pantoate--beta-alanine ligase
MGNLHAGHLSLLRAALRDFDVVYFSIFVNPLQFGPNEDYTRYPRTLEQDLSLIESELKDLPGKSVVVYAPQNPGDVFPAQAEQTISVLKLSDTLEGKLRPGHFDGVATVVHRLFEIVRPTRAYFGRKDYQQFLVIRQMVRDLALPVEIIPMPIIREPDGLAMSSRNQYLSPAERAQAPLLNQTLRQVEAAIAGQRAKLPLAQALIRDSLKDPNWNYLELRDAETLSEDLSRSTHLSLLGVYQLGPTRLLDNLQLEIR